MQPNMANVRTTVTTWWKGVPMATRAVFSTCIAMWVLSLVGVYNVYSACSGGYTLLGKWQLWRLFTSPVTHVGILHLLMNMSALLSLLPPLEKGHGTAGACTMLFVFALMAQVIAIGPATVFHVIFGVDAVFEWRACAVGISGVLFALLTLVVTTEEMGLLPVKRVLCGFAIPNGAYPWVMLVVIQLLVPGASFMGHVGGILSAYLFPPASLRWSFMWLDAKFPTILKSSSSYVPTNRSSLPVHEPSSVVSGLWSWQSSDTTTVTAAGTVAASAATATVTTDNKQFPGQGRTIGRTQSPAGPAPSPPTPQVDEAPKHA